jgi:hypothetical protein
MQFSAPRRSRVQEHVRLLGILWLGFSAFNAVGGLIAVVLSKTLFVHLQDQNFGGDPHWPMAFVRHLVLLAGVFVLAKAAAGFAAGWGLLKRDPWGRVLALVLAFLSLFNIPFGTALGVYTLWVLLPSQSERDYGESARAA